MKTKFAFLLIVIGASQTLKVTGQPGGTRLRALDRYWPTEQHGDHRHPVIFGGKEMKTRLALLFFALVSGYAQTTATFTEATSGLWTARSGHTSTVLANGKVLIAGGENGPRSFPASAELYDPSDGYFTPTSAMLTPRSGHSATLLPDGRVLITGGVVASVNTCCVAVSSTELYNPSTGTFTAAGGTSTVSGIAALLKNGKVLITGATTELYDPVTDSFAPTGSYAGPFYYGPFFYPDTATLLQDGRVLIVGSACGDCWLEHEEVYDPATGTFKAVGALHMQRRLRRLHLGGPHGYSAPERKGVTGRWCKRGFWGVQPRRTVRPLD